MFTIATWNINSVRLRAGLVERLLSEEAPDILCLQECKCPVELIPLEGFRALGYSHVVARGQKGYNGVAILSRLPLEDAGDRTLTQVLDQEGVGQLVRMATEKGRSIRPDLKCGICGEHGGEPSSVKFCHRVGLNYVSCYPFRVPIARLAAAQAAIEG